METVTTQRGGRPSNQDDNVTLKDYIAPMTTQEREAFAESIGTNWAYLRQVVNGHRNASVKLSRKLNKATGGKVPLKQIRPDVWA